MTELFRDFIHTEKPMSNAAVVMPAIRYATQLKPILAKWKPSGAMKI